jgi:hypothetical protein
MNKDPGAEEKFKEISAAYEVFTDIDWLIFDASSLYNVRLT